MTDPEEPRTGIEWAGLPSPEVLRAALGVGLGALLSLAGGLALGEFPFEGPMPWLAGVLFGLVVGELVVEVGRRRTLGVAVVTGVVSALGLLLAGWIAAGAGTYPPLALASAGIGFVAATARVWDRRGT